MPERVSEWLHEQLEDLVRLIAPRELGKHVDPVPLVPTASKGSRKKRNPRSGGVLPPRDSKASWAVNIRPKNWGDKDKFWRGKIKSKHDAYRISDIVHYYIGCGSVHSLFPGADQPPPPPFLNPSLSQLNDLEKRMQYVKQIAKGDQHQALRREFRESVNDMVRLLMHEDAACPPAAAAVFANGSAAAVSTEASAAVSADASVEASAAVSAETSTAGEDFAWACSACQPELDADECRLSPEFPDLCEDDIEYMMRMALDDAVS